MKRASFIARHVAGPGEGQRPGGEELGPDLGPAGPAVRAPLEADAGMADHERAQQRRGQGHPAAQAEQPGGAVDNKGPERLEQVHGPAEGGAGAEDRAHQAGQHRAQALVAHVLGRAEPDIGEPRGKREPPGLDGLWWRSGPSRRARRRRSGRRRAGSPSAGPTGSRPRPRRRRVGGAGAAGGTASALGAGSNRCLRYRPTLPRRSSAPARLRARWQARHSA